MLIPLKTQQPIGIFPIATVVVMGICLFLQVIAPKVDIDSIQERMQVFCATDLAERLISDLKTVPELKDFKKLRSCPWTANAIMTNELRPALEKANLDSDFRRIIEEDLAEAEDSLAIWGWRAFDPHDPELLSFFASAFTHSGWIHLIGNLIFIWVFGAVLENLIGPLKLLLVFLGADIFANLAYLLLSKVGLIEGLPSLGASAGSFGIMAGMLRLYPQLMVHTLFFLPPIVRIRTPGAWRRLGPDLVWKCADILLGLVESQLSHYGCDRNIGMKFTDGKPPTTAQLLTH